MSWQEELRRGVRTAEELAPLLGWSGEETARRAEVAKRFPMMITPYYLSLVDPKDPADPIARMCVPSLDEFGPGGSFDTSGEASNTKLEGLQHKYAQTVLLLSTNQCAMYCRHCFRKRMVGLTEDELNQRVDEAVDYVKRHKEITNILVSGGDAFMNSNAIIERYLRELTAIGHLDFIRFGSRVPVTLPERIYGDPEFLALFEEYHLRYPSHGYRWLNAKIRLDTGTVMSDPYAHKCCKTLGVKSGAKHYKYKKPGNPFKIYPNLLMTEMQIDRPLQCIVSDMTAFRVKGTYYELTLYMDLWNNEILSHSLSAKRGDRMTYISGLNDLTELKKQHPEYKTVLHSDQGSVYASKNYNELPGTCGIIHSMSRAGTPTDNAAMESINGWIKSELFTDFHLQGENVKEEMAAYIKFFNEERPAYSLGYLTPKQYRETYAAV